MVMIACCNLRSIDGLKILCKHFSFEGDKKLAVCTKNHSLRQLNNLILSKDADFCSEYTDRDFVEEVEKVEEVAEELEVEEKEEEDVSVEESPKKSNKKKKRN